MASSILPSSTREMSPRTFCLVEVVDIEVAPERRWVLVSVQQLLEHVFVTTLGRLARYAELVAPGKRPSTARDWWRAGFARCGGPRGTTFGVRRANEVEQLDEAVELRVVQRCDDGFISRV